MRLRIALAAVVILGATGCPNPPPLPPPPRSTTFGPLAQRLALRDAAIRGVRASAVLRLRLPEGAPGAPGGKLHAEVAAAAAPERARLELLTPIGGPAATLLIAGGELQVYEPYENRLVKGPVDSPNLAGASPIPVPLSSLPALLRGAVAIDTAGMLVETAPPMTLDSALTASGAPAKLGAIEVRDGARLLQRVLVDVDGGYPVQDVRFDDAGAPQLTVDYLDYGGAPAPNAAEVAFPQRVTVAIARPEGLATVDVRLSSIELDPKFDPSEFLLIFDRPPKVETIP